MDHSGVELGIDGTELLHWVTLFQEATGRLYVADPHNPISGSSISVYFPPSTSISQAQFFVSNHRWAVNQHLTFNRRIQPSNSPSANIMALGSAAISSLISVTYKWYACKKSKCSANVSSLSLLLFLDFFFLEEEKFQFRGNNLTKLPKTTYSPLKVEKPSSRASGGKWHSELIYFTALYWPRLKEEVRWAGCEERRNWVHPGGPVTSYKGAPVQSLLELMMPLRTLVRL